MLDDADPIDVLNVVAREKLINQKGRSRELAPIDLTTEPDIAALVETVDLKELTTEE